MSNYADIIQFKLLMLGIYYYPFIFIFLHTNRVQTFFYAFLIGISTLVMLNTSLHVSIMVGITCLAVSITIIMHMYETEQADRYLKYSFYILLTCGGLSGFLYLFTHINETTAFFTNIFAHF